MDNENIKEILEFKEDADYKRLSIDEIIVIKDYITNLQEENERLSVELNQNMIERNNYLSRNEKAREYIENEMPYLEEPDDDYENTHKMKEYDKSILLNILQGEENE